MRTPSPSPHRGSRHVATCARSHTRTEPPLQALLYSVGQARMKVQRQPCTRCALSWVPETAQLATLGVAPDVLRARVSRTRGRTDAPAFRPPALPLRAKPRRR